MAAQRFPLVLIAAVARNGVIGADNALPWRLSADLKRFKALTMGKPMIMGRKTFESIGKPLPGRETIVVTRSKDFHVAGVHTAASVDDAITLARLRAAAMGAGEIIVAGGGEIYRQTMAAADRLEITHVNLDAPGDAVFPAIDPAIWEPTARSLQPAGEKDDGDCEFVTYRRKPVAVRVSAH